MRPQHDPRCDCDRCWLENTDPDPRYDDLNIETCTNCGLYYTPRKDQDYYDTRCGGCK
jgi:NMD protein affecting ribosome stability and mRNA decay